MFSMLFSPFKSKDYISIACNGNCIMYALGPFSRRETIILKHYLESLTLVNSVMHIYRMQFKSLYLPNN